MMIGLNESPEHFLNKFLSIENEGCRGVLLARSHNKKQAVVLAANSSFDMSVKWGGMYLIKENNPDQYPKVIKKITLIPENFELILREET